MRKFNGIAVLSGGGGGCSLVAGGVVADAAPLLQTFVAEGPPGACYKPGKKLTPNSINYNSNYLSRKGNFA